MNVVLDGVALPSCAQHGHAIRQIIIGTMKMPLIKLRGMRITLLINRGFMRSPWLGILRYDIRYCKCIRIRRGVTLFWITRHGSFVLYWICCILQTDTSLGRRNPMITVDLKAPSKLDLVIIDGRRCNHRGWMD